MVTIQNGSHMLKYTMAYCARCNAPLSGQPAMATTRPQAAPQAIKSATQYPPQGHPEWLCCPCYATYVLAPALGTPCPVTPTREATHTPAVPTPGNNPTPQDTPGDMALPARPKLDAQLMHRTRNDHTRQHTGTDQRSNAA